MSDLAMDLSSLEGQQPAEVSSLVTWHFGLGSDVSRARLLRFGLWGFQFRLWVCIFVRCPASRSISLCLGRWSGGWIMPQHWGSGALCRLDFCWVAVGRFLFTRLGDLLDLNLVSGPFFFDAVATRRQSVDIRCRKHNWDSRSSFCGRGERRQLSASCHFAVFLFLVLRDSVWLCV